MKVKYIGHEIITDWYDHWIETWEINVAEWAGYNKWLAGFMKVKGPQPKEMG